MTTRPSTIFTGWKSAKIPCSRFSGEEFRQDLQRDLDLLREIQQAWTTVERDPNCWRLRAELHNHPILKKNKLIIFYRIQRNGGISVKHLDAACQGRCWAIAGHPAKTVREKVIENFDANARRQKDDYRILVDRVLSEESIYRFNVV